MVAVLKRKIRVILADDHPVVRDGLAATINQQPDMEVVAEASDGDEAIAPYEPVPYTHFRAHETRHDFVCRLLLEKKKNSLSAAAFGKETVF